jgi:hypothetical protein
MTTGTGVGVTDIEVGGEGDTEGFDLFILEILQPTSKTLDINIVIIRYIVVLNGFFIELLLS